MDYLVNHLKKQVNLIRAVAFIPSSSCNGSKPVKQLQFEHLQFEHLWFEQLQFEQLLLEQLKFEQLQFVQLQFTHLWFEFLTISPAFHIVNNFAENRY
jgi:hypothetical protein